MRPGSRLPALAAVLLASATSWLGCGGSGGGGDITEPQLGTLQITTVTSGTEFDADGYAVSIDGAAAEAVQANGVLRRERVATGPHTVELSGIAANCTLTGAARRTVDVTADGIADESFAITCAPTTGAIRVTTASGEPADEDGYTLLVDGIERQPIGVAASVTLPGIPAGAHTVGLGGVSGNCAVGGDNPRSVAVAAGGTVEVSFAVTCEPPPAAAGTLEVTTATSGGASDPDGYRFRIDGGDSREIGVSGTVAVTSVAAGPHQVELTGVAANCAVSGENPRGVTVPAGGTGRVAFEVTCAATTGSLTVAAATSGAPADPDGYRVSVDGGSPRTLGVNGSVTFQSLAAGDHAVLLDGIAPNCTPDGDNPRTVNVSAGGTAQTTFTVVCAATTGKLTVTVAGLPSGADAAVTVTGPGNFSRSVTATRTLNDLAAGDYTVSAAEVSAGGSRYTATPASQTVAVAAGGSASAAVTYAAAAATLNLRIDGWQLTQGIQTGDNGIPLIANRDGYLRVFVVANETNRATPRVRVRLYRNGNLSRTFLIPAPGGSTPTQRADEPLAASWNVKIPRDLIAQGLEVLADVDPDNEIVEQDEDDNRFPVSGTAAAPQVRTAPVLGVRFVPVRQQASGLTGDVSDANRGRYLELTRKLYPLPGTDGDVHAVYTTATSEPLQPGNANGAWGTVLGELELLRVAEASGRSYYGVVRLDYSSGLAGVGFIGVPTAMGYDDPGDRARVVAHELGHTWGRDHTPSCGPPEVDPTYPYPGGGIGVYGLDVGQEILKPPTVPDIMGYCGDPWISDYTYEAVRTFRAQSGVVMTSGGPQRSLLVWGRVVEGRPVLEPAFELVTRPTLPARPGPYAVEALAADGSRLFEVSFDAVPVADDPRGSRHFAFAVPLGEAAAARLGSLRLRAPTGDASAVRAALPGAAARAPTAVEARRTGGGVALRWDAAQSPMVMVRDPRTGQVLSLARGGAADVVTDAAELELLVSDRVGSRRLVVPVAR